MTTELVTTTRQPLAPLATQDEKPVIITTEQVDLIRATLAADATDAELALFFYDCKRRGVHPLDKLIHFTKRKGKYTPVTSIDFFRSRAARTREHMGTDEILYVGAPGDLDFAASCTVYRMVQGEKCPFTATARFAEYVPDATNDFMWKKMPHSQLGKCAEALALRRGFPQELADLHVFEELDRAEDPVTPTVKRVVQRASEKTAMGTTHLAGSPVTDSLCSTPRCVKDVRAFGKGNANFALVLDGDPTEYTTKDAKLTGELGKFKGTDHRIRVTFKDNEWNGKVYHNIESFTVDPNVVEAVPPPKTDPLPPLTAGDIPFGR